MNYCLSSFYLLSHTRKQKILFKTFSPYICNKKLVEKQSRAMKTELKATKSDGWVIIWGFNSHEPADLHLD